MVYIHDDAVDGWGVEVEREGESGIGERRIPAGARRSLWEQTSGGQGPKGGDWDASKIGL